MCKNRRVSSVAVCCAVYATGGLGSFLGAADISWNNPSGGSFLSAANWNPTVIPGASDRAIFNLGASYVLTPGIGSLMTVSNQQMLIGNDNVRFIMGIASPSCSLTGATDSVIVGDTAGQVGTLSIGQGTINVMGGVLHSRDAVVGNLPGSSGAVTMAGVNTGNSEWRVDGTLYLGRGGHGSFFALVRSSLRATNLSLGAEPGAGGYFNVGGGGAFVTVNVAQDVFVGGSGAGSGGTGGFSIIGGGTVVDANFGGTFHVYENGVAKFDGARATTLNHLDVAGGRVEMVGMGSPRVNGNISVSNGGSLILALDSASTPDSLTIAGGKVNAAGLINYSGAGAIGAPAVGIAGQEPSIYSGTATFAGPLYIGGNGSGPGGPGEYIGNVTADSVRLWPEGSFHGGYSVTAAGGVINGGVIGGGSLTVAGEATTINGNYAQNNDGNLLIRLGAGVAGDQSDRLVVTGAATLDGVLDLLLVSPPTADSFTILTATGGVSGQWDNAMGTIAVGGLTYAVNYSPTSVELSLVPEPAAAAIAAMLLVLRRRRTGR